MHTAIHESEAVQDFLKAVYLLQQGSDRVQTSALAKQLSVSPSSVTDMGRRMVEAGMIIYEKYYGMRLTAGGEQVALRVIRRHRLLEVYLIRELGYALHEVHEEAERMEHAVSDQFIEIIAQKLDNPTFDQYGDVIPGTDGTIPCRQLQLLTRLPTSIKARIAYLNPENLEILQYLASKNFKLGVQIEVVSREPFDGPITLLIDDIKTVLGHMAAGSIFVETEV